MQSKSIRQIVAWMTHYNLKVNERLFFQMAYVQVYGKAEPRCELCYEDYVHKGKVPLFVRIFIQQYFVVKGVAK